jgi:GT2 family glycosyltransferase
LPVEVPLSIIIVSWNVRRDLESCLQSLRANAEAGAEIVVVDNASRDDTLTMLAGYPEVRVIANDVNRGFAAANNQGLAVARGRWLLLLNPDTLMPEAGLRKLLEFADNMPLAGIIGPRLLNSDGSLQSSCRRFPTVRAALYRHTILGRLRPDAAPMRDYLMAEWDHQTPREVDWVSGACLLIRRETFAQVGPLDEGFYWGSEDVDYCFRAHRAGWQVWYTPQPAVVHAIGRSSDQAILRTIVRTHRSMQRLYTKHLARNWFTRTVVTVGIWLRAALLLVTVLPRLLWFDLKHPWKKTHEA